MIRKSCTQTSEAIVVEKDNHAQYKCNFTFPFDYQLIATPEAGMSANRTKIDCYICIVEEERWPSLLLQVNSVDSWNRHRIEGYGFITFPAIPGYHDITISTWKPLANLYSKIHSFFLGGSVRILQLDHILKTNYLDALVIIKLYLRVLF